MHSSASPLLLYDGLCGFCDGTVRFVLRRDLGGQMRFATLQGRTGAAILRRHPRLRAVDSLVLVERNGGEESCHIRSEALLRICRYLGGPWRLTAALHILPRWLRDQAYELFARNRYRLFGRFGACPLPPEEMEDRFLP
jgi:predicted DCC family thiol-disulfide oxidoreductase YuxK